MEQLSPSDAVFSPCPIQLFGEARYLTCMFHSFRSSFWALEVILWISHRFIKLLIHYHYLVLNAITSRYGFLLVLLQTMILIKCIELLTIKGSINFKLFSISQYIGKLNISVHVYWKKVMRFSKNINRVRHTLLRFRGKLCSCIWDILCV